MVERVEDQSAQDLADRMQAVFERRDNTEIAAAAAQRPEQIRIVGRAGRAELAIGGDHLGGDQVVHGRAVLAHQPAQTAAEGKARDAGIGDGASGGGEAMGLRRLVEFAP